jgi:hypothetical protein
LAREALVTLVELIEASTDKRIFQNSSISWLVALSNISKDFPFNSSRLKIFDSSSFAGANAPQNIVYKPLYDLSNYYIQK